MNPFDIRRENLLEQLEKMRVNFDLQVEVNAVHQLAGGMPGQKIKLQHAGIRRMLMSFLLISLRISAFKRISTTNRSTRWVSQGVTSFR